MAELHAAPPRFRFTIADGVGAGDVRNARIALTEGLRAWARPATLTVDAQDLSSPPFALLPQIVALVLELRPLAQNYLSHTTLLCSSPSWRTWVGRLTAVAPTSAPVVVVVLPRTTAARLGACVRGLLLTNST